MQKLRASCYSAAARRPASRPESVQQTASSRAIATLTPVDLLMEELDDTTRNPFELQKYDG